MTHSAVASPGLTVVPAASETVDVDGLPVANHRSLVKGYIVTCTEPGLHTVDFTTSIAPKLASVVDPDGGDNTRSTSITMDCAVPVTINVQPGSTRNPVNRNGSTLPVAALSTAAGEYGNPRAFDATTIDPLSVRFASRSALLAGTGVGEVHAAAHPEDSLELDEVTRDGDLDAVLHFRPRSEAVALTDTHGCVYGRTEGSSGPVSFFGCDPIDVTK